MSNVHTHSFIQIFSRRTGISHFDTKMERRTDRHGQLDGRPDDFALAAVY